MRESHHWRKLQRVDKVYIGVEEASFLLEKVPAAAVVVMLFPTGSCSRQDVRRIENQLYQSHLANPI